MNELHTEAHRPSRLSAVRKHTSVPAWISQGDIHLAALSLRETMSTVASSETAGRTCQAHKGG
jgi:hypothetical protein